MSSTGASSTGASSVGSVEPIRVAVTVAASPERAWTVFTKQIDSWEAYGAEGPKAHASYGGDEGWPVVLEAFLQVFS
jgi:hypothetical protein